MGRGAITITTRGFAVGSHKNKMEHTQQKTTAADWRPIKFIQTTVPNSPFTDTTVFLIQQRSTECGQYSRQNKKLNFIYIYIYIYTHTHTHTHTHTY